METNRGQHSINYVDKSADRVSEMAQCVYGRATSVNIKEKGFVTDRGYAERTDRTKATRAKDLQKLVSLGLIEQRGKGRATYYVMKD